MDADQDATRIRGRPKADQNARRLAALRGMARLCRRVGLDAATMDDLATETGLAKPAIYRLGLTKQQLIDAALNNAAEAMRAALACWPDPREVVARALAYARAEPDLFLFLMSTARGSPSTAAIYDDIAALTARQLLVLVWRNASHAPAPLRRAAFACGALLHEAMVRQAQAAVREDECFLDWCETMIRAWVAATATLHANTKRRAKP